MPYPDVHGVGDAVLKAKELNLDKVALLEEVLTEMCRSM